MMALGEPVFKDWEMKRRVGNRHTGQDKSQPVRFFKDGLFEGVSH
jgi:hypothetical protein